MPRLFIAIDLPEAIKDQLIAFQQDDVPPARWVKPYQMHLTLRFLGETDERQSEAIKAALEKVEAEPFEMLLRGLGQFPPDGRARVLWVGVRNSPRLRRLYEQIEAQLQPVGFEPEARRFHPHITLARFKMPPRRGVVDHYIRKHADFYTDPFPVTQFILYSSRLTPQGPVYQHEWVYKLG